MDTTPTVRESAQPCGCDPGENWLCHLHKTLKENKEQSVYRVEVETPGCEHCGAGKQWAILDVSTDTYILGQTFGDEEEAEAICAAVNRAYQVGLERLP